MDYIKGIQRAIDYVEEHITEKIDYEAVAKCAFASSFHFQRVFSIICGLTLGDYIRNRRLTLAGEELVKGDKKVIDIAFKYGYDSPESFTRAFSKFHSITPTGAKNGETIKNYSRLCVKLIFSGGNTMNYRIEKLGAIKVVCKRNEFHKNQELTTKEISQFWAKCSNDGTIPTVCSFIPKEPKLKGLVGISFTGEGSDEMFPYGIGAEYNGNGDIPNGFDVINIKAQSYAVFTVKGAMPDAFVKTYKEICTEFFPQSDYEYANSVEFEVYPSDDVKNKNYTCEIWVGIK